MQKAGSGFSKFFSLLKTSSKQKTLLIGVFVAALFVLGGYYSIAKSKFKPTDILNSSFGENTFTVSWFTDWKTTGAIEVADNKEFKNSMIFEDVRDYDVNGLRVTSQPRNSHVVTARKLEPEKQYYYRVKTQYNNVFDETYQTITTPKVSYTLQTPKPIYGEVVDKNGNALENVLVEIYVKEADGVESSRLITYTQKNGTYSADISNIRRNNIDEFWAPTEGIGYQYVITARTNTESYFVETLDELTPVKTFAFEALDSTYSKIDNSLASKLVGKANAQSNTCDAEKKAADQCFADYNYCNQLKGKPKPMKPRADFPGDTVQVFDDSLGPESCYNEGAREDLLNSCKTKENNYNTCLGRPNPTDKPQTNTPREPNLSNESVAVRNGCTYFNDNEVFKCEGSGIARAYNATCTNAKHTYANGACDNFGGKSNPGAGDRCRIKLEKGEKCLSEDSKSIIVTPPAKPAAPAPKPTTPPQPQSAPRCDGNFAINNGKQVECDTNQICRLRNSIAVCETREQNVPVVAPVNSTQPKQCTNDFGTCTLSDGKAGYCGYPATCKPLEKEGATCLADRECESGLKCEIKSQADPNKIKVCKKENAVNNETIAQQCSSFTSTSVRIKCTTLNGTDGNCSSKTSCAGVLPAGASCAFDVECPAGATCKQVGAGKACTFPPTPTQKPTPTNKAGAQQILSPLSSATRLDAKVAQVVKTGETVDPGLYTSPSGTTLDLQAPTKVTFFVDANGNGKRDTNEQIVTDQAYQLVKQQDAFTYNVLNGWNSLNFPFYKSDTTMYKASELVEEAAKQGITIETIKSWDGSWIDYTKKDGKTYTGDFVIVPNKGYFIKSTVKGTFNLFGTTPTEPVSVQMLNGWTLVGAAPGFNANKEKVFKQPEFRDGITAFEFIRTANKTNPQFALDNMTKYDSGVYRGVNYSKNASGTFVEFGLDFSIENLESYFVRSYSKNVFTP